MDESFFFKNRDNENVAAIIHNPKNSNDKGIVFLHCFTCTKHHRIVRTVSERLAAEGYTVLRFDFSGNGESEGNIEDATYTKMITEVKEAVSILKKKGIEKIGLVGHSMGAMLSLLTAYEDKRVSVVAFISGSSQGARVREIFPTDVLEKAEKIGSAETSIYNRMIKIKREFLLDVERYNVGYAVAELKRPLLIVHGTMDNIIPSYHARQLYAWAHEPKTFKLIEGADHLFKNEKHLNELKETVTTWFNQNL